ncbi:MAG TPA: 3-phosphoserine/phosphohydroxythreonine transaminase [Dehalococcoidia bacterium]|nr:3-phosphoserine/phosphohydroxythreonine transaminase [SAR202 cluster bacterium]HAA94885.1 3-phosphoserine/phosphohydroxythreonine transaminase [Dehalococcoidia bacterium]
MTERVFNFAAGPATLPLSVLQEAQEQLVSYQGMGMSLLEMSHRSKPVEEVIAGAEENIRRLASIPDNYKIMFLQGGASSQFSMVPMNLLTPGGTADHIVTGNFAKLALQDAQKVGDVRLAGSTEEQDFVRVPLQEELDLNPAADYVHITGNNTIYGTEWPTEPEVGAVPLVSDISSDIFSKPLYITKYGLVYAGAQKNLGAAGVTLVIIREDLLSRSADNLPAMLNYNTHIKSNSAYNTPPVFAIYILGLVIKWLKAQGGLERIAEQNMEKARVLYDALDSSEFYRGHAEPGHRSMMNVTFRLPTADLESQFISESTENGFNELKGHRSVGGIRASLYNAFPKAGAEALVSFMKDFERTNG